MATDADSSFLFDGFVKSPSFDENLALFGDSKRINESSLIQLTDSVSQSEGRVVYRKPIKLFQGKDMNPVSFSTAFSFEMPNEVLAFVMVPSSLDLNLFHEKGNNSSGLGFLLQHAKNNLVIAFEFDISDRGNHARILIGKPESSEIQNLSFPGDLIMNPGGIMSCMIEYISSSKKMLVRFRKSGSIKLVDPFFKFSVDLVELWKDGEFMIGLSSVNGNSSKAHFLHSWRFGILSPPPTMVMLPEPLDPFKVSEVEEDPEESMSVFTDESII